jgi:hypothetical protein
MADGGLDASRLMLRDLCEYTEPWRRGAAPKAFKDVPNDETGLKLPVVDGGRELADDANGEKASSKVEGGNVAVGDGSSTSESASSFVLVFLHLENGLNRLVHWRGEGSESQTEAVERKDLNEWRSFIAADDSSNSDNNSKTIHVNLLQQAGHDHEEGRGKPDFKLRSACGSRRTIQRRPHSAENWVPPQTRRQGLC